MVIKLVTNQATAVDVEAGDWITSQPIETRRVHMNALLNSLYVTAVLDLYSHLAFSLGPNPQRSVTLNDTAVNVFEFTQKMKCTQAGGRRAFPWPCDRPGWMCWLIDRSWTSSSKDTVLFLFAYESGSVAITHLPPLPKNGHLLWGQDLTMVTQVLKTQHLVTRIWDLNILPL